MIYSPPPSPPTEPPAPNLDQVHREQVRRELEHRFRHGLRANQVNPLLHLLMHYKLEHRQ